MRSLALAALIAAWMVQNGVPVVSLQAALAASTSCVAPRAAAGKRIETVAASSAARARLAQENVSGAICLFLQQGGGRAKCGAPSGCLQMWPRRPRKDVN